MINHSRIHADELHGLAASELKFVHVGLGGGYGYNFVPGKGWLIHVSALPHLIVFDRSSYVSGGKMQRLHYRFPEMIITGRFAVVRNFKHTFLGTQVVANYSADGSKRNLFISNQKWRGRLFFGVRF